MLDNQSFLLLAHIADYCLQFSYFAEAERESVSMRTKQGLAARASGKKLGRPKGSRDKERVLDSHREQIKECLQLGISLSRIRTILNPQHNWNGRLVIRRIDISFVKIRNYSSFGKAVNKANCNLIIPVSKINSHCTFLRECTQYPLLVLAAVN